jgi:beta-barrel assembly-enhancing protease
MSKYVPKEITVEVNSSPTHPLVDLAYLFAKIALVMLAIYGTLGVLASHLATRMDVKTEERIGAALTKAIPSKAPEADQRLDYLNQLVASLESDGRAVQGNRAKTALSDGQYPPVKLRILDTDDENAMVTAGSYLFVTDGLLANVKSENELAFVLAHELGHLHHRDSLKALGRSLVLVTLASALGQSGRLLPNLINVAELSYSRNQETAADDYALAIIMARYGHGGSSLGFFERQQTADLGILDDIGEWSSSHPLTRDRIEHLNNQFNKNGWKTTGESTPLPENFNCENLKC